MHGDASRAVRVANQDSLGLTSVIPNQNVLGWPTSVRRASSAPSCRTAFLPHCPLTGAAGEAIVSSNRQPCVMRATRASPMAAPNHVLCPCRRTRRPRTPGSLQRSPPPGPGPPLSPSLRGTQRCLLRRYFSCRCCFLPTPQSRMKDDSVGVGVAPTATPLPRDAAERINRRSRSIAARARVAFAGPA